jgi:microcystin-dependent protein
MEPFIGEVILFAGNFAPKGWSFCNGQLLSISVNTPLFSILGITYGGDGISTFGLPDLRGRTPIHPGTGIGLTKRTLGETGGAETIILKIDQLPAHTHAISVTTDIPIFYEDVTSDRSGVFINQEKVNQISNIQKRQELEKNINQISSELVGQSIPHNNMQPFQCVNYIIALQGVYPARS